MGTGELMEALAALSEEELAAAMPKIRALCSTAEFQEYPDAETAVPSATIPLPLERTPLDRLQKRS